MATDTTIMNAQLILFVAFYTRELCCYCYQHRTPSKASRNCSRAPVKQCLVTTDGCVYFFVEVKFARDRCRWLALLNNRSDILRFSLANQRNRYVVQSENRLKYYFKSIRHRYAYLALQVTRICTYFNDIETFILTQIHFVLRFCVFSYTLISFF